MSTQEKHRKGCGTWLCSTAAKREYYLSVSDLESLAHRYRQVEQPLKGRPVKLWNSDDLKQAADMKYGKEVFQTKVDKRTRWRRIRNLPVANSEVTMKAAGAIMKCGRKKKVKRITKIKAKELDTEEDNQESSDDLEGLCECVKKCDKDQLEQIISLMGQKEPSYVTLFNEVREVALLPRSKFQLVESKLAKLLSSSDDETDSGHSRSQEDDEEEESEEDEQRKLNMALEGTWTLTTAAPQWKKGEEGSLEVILFGSGLSVNGDISFPTSCIFGDIVGFKTNSSIEDTSMCFETRSKMCHKWYTGALCVFISRDDEGLRVSGSFWPGFKEQDPTNTFQFTGRKADNGDD